MQVALMATSMMYGAKNRAKLLDLTASLSHSFVVQVCTQSLVCVQRT